MNTEERRTKALAAIAEMLHVVEADLAIIDAALANYRPVTTPQSRSRRPRSRHVPMWTHQPTRVTMESRGKGDDKYLYLYWALGDHSRYLSPTGGRKTYIGVDPESQKLAVVMVSNGKDQIYLANERGQIANSLDRINYRLEDAVRDSTNLLRRSQDSSAPTSRG